MTSAGAYGEHPHLTAVVQTAGAVLLGWAGGRIAGVRWRIRPFARAGDRQWAQGLWVAAMPPSWPLLPAGIAVLGEGVVAEAGMGPVGLAGVDMAGSIPLILVHPACQGRGIGTDLLAAALDRLRAGGSGEVTAGSGGRGYLWPGVPRDLPAAAGYIQANRIEYVGRRR
jgi:ribosomal protein S18 acetylase RimI-like enzyme